MHVMSPSDIVGPSPVTSNGTETTEIEDDATEEVRRASSADESPERRRSEVQPPVEVYKPKVTDITKGTHANDKPTG